MEKIIAIIESKEKRLGSYILGEVFKNEGYRVKAISCNDKNFENLIDLKGNVDIILLEIDLEGLKKVSQMNIDIDVFIDIDINNHKRNQEKHLLDKMNLIHKLKKDTLLVINGDDSESVKLGSINDKPIVMTYGLNSKNSITISSLNFDHRTNFNLCLQRRLKTTQASEVLQFEHPIDMNLINMDQLYSVIAVISACIYHNIDIDLIEKTLLKTKV